jgi:cytosine permease
MATSVPKNETASPLPDFVASAKPVPKDARIPWYKSTAQTYAGVMLWFVFWQSLLVTGTAGGILAAGIPVAILGIILAAAICHFLFFLVPGLLGMKTGLPLYIVGTSTYGVQGGLIMPGFLMGALQFGWLGVNAFGVATLLCKVFGFTATAPSPAHGVIATTFAIFAAFMGLKGIKYVARVATFLPLIPVVVLILLIALTAGGLGNFNAADVVNATSGEGIGEALPWYMVIASIVGYIVGFFATAGAAGVDIAMGNRDEKDVQTGGLTGIGLATLFAGGLAVLVVAGAFGLGKVPATMDAGMSKLNPLDLMRATLVGESTANGIMILLAISSFPGACFSAFIAVNSFKTTMPKVNPYVSVGIGTLISIVMAVSGKAGDVTWVFALIGASFGPICGAMVADYLLSGCKWAGPRASFNPAGWISWAVGFAVGADVIPGLKGNIPVLPVVAFVIGFVLYVVLAKAGLESRKLDMPPGARADA